MGRIVIVGYKPFSGKDKSLMKLIVNHWAVLHNEGLVSERKPIIMKSANGTIVEVFEWKSKEAIEAARSNTAVLEMWEEFAKVCEYIPVGEIAEAMNLFSEFTPVD